ncbi:HpcH/HpaI aldolase/citrate lyase family protein [Yunchengibacter salinarum]|uniref:HpcH/HpaI aldolase/citrate lyase family protein n=1 Tax=Yunchengibacter salinarum TaxID=3133399 RepID=UPI0035B59AF1
MTRTDGAASRPQTMCAEPPGSRPLRSLLFMPGSNARALEKARGLPADGVIIDLEDAVAPDQKEGARDQARAALAQGMGNRLTALRINGVDTPWWRDDVAAAVAGGADAVVIPKVESPAPVLDVAGALFLEGAPRSLAIWVMLETPASFLALEAIARSHPRLGALVLGTNDLAHGLKAAHVPGRAPLSAALSMALLTARAHGLAALDGVYNRLKDTAGLEEECRAGAALGFDGKTLIHPGQIEAANTAFAPDPDAVANARKLVAAWEESDGGVVRVDGHMVEDMHVRDARDLIARAEALREQQ